MTSKPRKRKPLHPFPIISVGPNPHKNQRILHLRKTPFQKDVISLLKSGARILFDIKRKRALVYTFKNGLEYLKEITTRTLSALLNAGFIVCAWKEDRLVHYVLRGQSTSWYRPE